MNRWQCSHHGCEIEAAGTGGAVGLRAIGWYFEPGPELFCPAHRPHAVPCRDNPENEGKPCCLCAAEEAARPFQAELWTPEDQEILERLSKMPLRSWPL